MGETKYVKTFCKNCHGACGVIVTVVDGVIRKLEGDPDFPITKGKMCPKGLAAIQEVYNPNRLRYPLKRSGERGEGKWQRISWEEASDTIASKMRESMGKNGPDSVALSQGTGRGYNSHIFRLARTIGTPNVLTPGTICYVPTRLMCAITIGGKIWADYSGWGGEFPKTIIAWARQNEINSIDGDMPLHVLEAANKAKNIICIDPRATRLTSRLGAQWLQIRPGTDAALALGMMNVIINEGLYNKEFVANWTYGFDQLKERVQQYPPEKAAEITWIPKQKIIKAARTFATDTPGVIQIGEPLEGGNNAIQTIRAILCLIGITGNIEKPGSMVRRLPAETGDLELQFGPELPRPEAKTIGSDTYKLTQLVSIPTPHVFFQQLVDGISPIKVFHVQGTNPVLCMSDAKKVFRGMMKIPFISVADMYLSVTAEYADIVLPVAHWLEMDAIIDEHWSYFVGACRKIIEPEGEPKPDSDIFNEIGKRIKPEQWFDNNEALMDFRLRAGNITFKELKNRGYLLKAGKEQPYYKYKTEVWKKGGGFRTRTGKYELYSSFLESYGYDPLPHYKEPAESPYSTPELAKEYPLILSTGGRSPWFFHSQYRQVPWLKERQADPFVDIHPETAVTYGIAEGDWVWIETPRGRIRQRAYLTKGILPSVINVQTSWWYPDKPGPDHGMWDVNANVLTSSDANSADNALGCYTTRALLCKIYKVGKEELK